MLPVGFDHSSHVSYAGEAFDPEFRLKWDSDIVTNDEPILDIFHALSEFSVAHPTKGDPAPIVGAGEVAARYGQNGGSLVKCGMILSAVISEAEEGGFVAYNPETGTTTQGETRDEAVANLREATELYLEEFPREVKGPAMVTSFEVTHAEAAGR